MFYFEIQYLMLYFETQYLIFNFETHTQYLILILILILKSRKAEVLFLIKTKPIYKIKINNY